MVRVRVRVRESTRFGVWGFEMFMVPGNQSGMAFVRGF